jgi:hypothetical protein
MTSIQDVKRVHGGYIQGEIIGGQLHVHKIFGSKLEDTDNTRLNWNHVRNMIKELEVIHEAMSESNTKGKF